jgi:hypothetical protein
MKKMIERHSTMEQLSGTHFDFQSFMDPFHPRSYGMCNLSGFTKINSWYNHANCYIRQSRSVKKNCHGWKSRPVLVLLTPSSEVRALFCIA